MKMAACINCCVIKRKNFNDGKIWYKELFWGVADGTEESHFSICEGP